MHPKGHFFVSQFFLFAVSIVCLLIWLELTFCGWLGASEDAYSLAFSYIPEYPYYPVEETQFSHVITIQAPSALDSADRAPVSVTAVLDRSGSMAGDKLELLKKSTEFLVESLQEGDSFGVVSYSVDVSSSSRASNLDHLQSGMSAID